MSKKNQKILALYIIKLGKHFANSYDLCKVLSWKFGLINCSEIIDWLISDYLIIRNENNGGESFELTGKAIEIIEENKSDFFSMLKVEYPNEPMIEYFKR